MTVTSLIWFLLIGFVAGFLASRVMGGRQSPVVYIIVGVIGALLGGWLFRLLGIYTSGGIVGPLITAFVGAVVFIAIVRAIR
jgi:uncharacterized membrane protein YeaQ/YmgE (transglycosylase-associated protein family)